MSSPTGRRHSPSTKEPRRSVLNPRSANDPLTEREWLMYRRGAAEGARRLGEAVKKASGSRAAMKAIDEFLLRLACGGVELDVPTAPSAKHPMDAWKPQLKRDPEAA